VTSVDRKEFLATQFESNRSYLRGVAYRMLGTLTEAEDAVQEAWLRLNRSDTNEVQNLRGWLRTVVANVCLDMLRSRKARREESFEDQLPETIPGSVEEENPESEALLADSVGLALLVVLDTLTPAERIAFVLHDTFGVSFDEISSIIGRTSEATRQLASRARRRVQGVTTLPDADLAGQRQVVDRFLTALRSGDFDGLLAVLDPDVVVRVDVPARPGAPTEIRGASNWARGAVAFSRLARFVQPALIDGSVGLVVAPNGRLTRALRFTLDQEKIVAVEVIVDASRLRELRLNVLSD
jgi:RNA polymerase sigma factor (sigma-70 family)